MPRRTVKREFKSKTSMEKFVCAWRNTRATKKVFLLSVLLLALPALGFSIFLYENQTEHFYHQLMGERNMAIGQLTDNIRRTLISVSELSRDLAYRSPIQSLLERPHLEQFPIWSSNYLSDMASSIKYSLKFQNYGVEAAYVLFLESDVSEEQYFRAVSRIEELPFFENFKSSGSHVAIYHLSGKESADYYASCHGKSDAKHSDIVLLIRAITTTSEKVIGYIVFEMPSSDLFPSLYQYSGEDGGYFAWFEDSGSSYGAYAPEGLIQALDTRPSGRGILSVGEHQYLYESIENFRLIIADSQPVSREPYVRSALNLSLILIWLTIAQLLLLNLFMKRTFSRLNKDLNEMDLIVANGFEGRIPVGREDEAGQIAIRYNMLLDKINGLISDVVKKETANTKAQLKALQYQINPHFIYNTLSIFSGYSEQKGEWELAEAIASFGHLLRYNIKSDGLYSTIDMEMANARSLINVYSIRHFNRITLDIQVAPEIRGHRLMKFLIQPILENSILHGMADARTSLLIQIVIHIHDGILEVILCDNGIGMSAHRLQEIRDHIAGNAPAPVSEGKGSFIGLRNIYERLRLFYGDQSTMEIDSVENEGTQIRIHLPMDPSNRV